MPDRLEPPVAPASSASGAPLRRAPAPLGAAASVGAEQDAALLQQARRAASADPARALTLTRDHELHFPESGLSEERQALRVEALARLGRAAEAARELAAFLQYPTASRRNRYDRATGAAQNA